MESFFSTVKSELVANRNFDSHGDAKMELFDYIEMFYNQRRRHSTLGQISPAAFERQAASGHGRCHPCVTHRTRPQGFGNLAQNARFPLRPHPSSLL